jgi:hypothetical protein
MSRTVENFGEYSVKNVKSFTGREGYGFNANLYRGRKKIAFCRDMAHGGEVDVDWSCGTPPRNRDDYPTEDAYNQAWAEYRQANQEEKDLLQAHLDTLPSVPSNFEGHGDLTIDAGWFVSDCVAKFESEKDLRKMRKQCQTKTLFRKASAGLGQYQICKAPCDDTMRARLRRDFGDDVEIFNDVLANNEIPSVLRD